MNKVKKTKAKQTWSSIRREVICVGFAAFLSEVAAAALDTISARAFLGVTVGEKLDVVVSLCKWGIVASAVVLPALIVSSLVRVNRRCRIALVLALALGAVALWMMPYVFGSSLRSRALPSSLILVTRSFIAAGIIVWAFTRFCGGMRWGYMIGAVVVGVLVFCGASAWQEGAKQLSPSMHSLFESSGRQYGWYAYLFFYHLLSQFLNPLSYAIMARILIQGCIVH